MRAIVWPTDHFLNNFVAHNLSSLTKCSAPDISAHGPWLSAFVLTTTFRVELPPETRAYAFNFLRKAEGAIFAYKDARSALLEYVAAPRRVISPYFRSLSSFESCIAQCFQGFKLISTGSKQALYKENDGSKFDRIRVIHNTAKHMDERIENGEIPKKATSPIWLTNEGIEALGKKSISTSLSFTELAGVLDFMSELAEKFSRLEPPA